MHSCTKHFFSYEEKLIKQFSQELENHIEKVETVLICLQKGNDLDTMASGLTLAECIKNHYDKEVFILQVNVKTTLLGDIEKWMPPAGEKLGNEKTLFITTDINNPKQILSPTKKIAEKCLKVIKIDHHDNSLSLGLNELVFLLPSYSSCSEIIWQLIKQLKWKTKPKQVENLFLGLYSDSRNLIGEKVSSRTFSAISEMHLKGANVTDLMRKLNAVTIPELHLISDLVKQSFNTGGLLVLNLHPQTAYHYFPANFRRKRGTARITQKKLMTFPLNTIEAMTDINTIIYIHYCLYEPFNTERRYVFVVLIKPNEKIEELLEENGFYKQRNRYSREIKLSDILKFIKENEEILKE